jgi:hypothetical protein
MDLKQLVGRTIHVRGADLFGAPVAAAIRAIDPDSNSLLLEFVAPAQIGAQTYPFAVARPRLQLDDLGVLLCRGTLGCAITCVPHDRYDAAKPFDLNWWRGEGATIADVVL